MKHAVFMFTLMILVAPAILAKGLEITEIDVHVDYDEAYTYRLENKDRIDSTSVSITNDSKINVDVLPGSNVMFTVRVENTFQGQDPKLRGVFATITIEDIDDGADLEGESIDFDLEPGDDERVDIKFSIPLDVDTGTYKVIMEAEGEDRNETSYNTRLNLKLEVKKQSHDIRITKILLNPSVADCDRKAKLTAEIMNLGSNAENEIALEFKSGNLGINSFDRNIFLESSADAGEEEKMHTKTLNIEVPSFFKAGTYPIFVNLYWKNFVLFDQKTVDLVVRDCISIPNETEVIKPKEEIEKAGEESKQQEIITATKEASILNSPILFTISLGGVIITILIILVVVGYLREHWKNFNPPLAQIVNFSFNLSICSIW